MQFLHLSFFSVFCPLSLPIFLRISPCLSFISILSLSYSFYIYISFDCFSFYLSLAILPPTFYLLFSSIPSFSLFLALYYTCFLVRKLNWSQFKLSHFSSRYFTLIPRRKAWQSNKQNDIIDYWSEDITNSGFKGPWIR